MGKPPKEMVKIMENPIKMDDLGGFTTPIVGCLQIVDIDTLRIQGTLPMLSTVHNMHHRRGVLLLHGVCMKQYVV